MDFLIAPTIVWALIIWWVLKTPGRRAAVGRFVQELLFWTWMRR